MRGRERCLQYLYACKPSLCMQASGEKEKEKKKKKKKKREIPKATKLGVRRGRRVGD